MEESNEKLPDFRENIEDFFPQEIIGASESEIGRIQTSGFDRIANNLGKDC